jgi:hypothetical protein
MNWLLALLRKSGLMPAFSADEMLNASTEEAFRIHAKAVQEVAARSKSPSSAFHPRPRCIGW